MKRCKRVSTRYKLPKCSYCNSNRSVHEIFRTKSFNRKLRDSSKLLKHYKDVEENRVSEAKTDSKYVKNCKDDKASSVHDNKIASKHIKDYSSYIKKCRNNKTSIVNETKTDSEHSKALVHVNGSSVTEIITDARLCKDCELHNYIKNSSDNIEPSSSENCNCCVSSTPIATASNSSIDDNYSESTTTSTEDNIFCESYEVIEGFVKYYAGIFMRNITKTLKRDRIDINNLATLSNSLQEWKFGILEQIKEDHDL